MKFRIKILNMLIGAEPVAVLSSKDATALDIHHMDRIKIVRRNRTDTVAVEIAKDTRAVPSGRVGIFSDIAREMKFKDGSVVDIVIARKPLSLELIRKKLDGIKLSKNEIDQIVWDIVNNKLSDVELAYFIAACYTNVLTIEETIDLIKSMVKYGDVLKLDKRPIIDKHCIGGIPGNRTTLIIVPIIAAAGYTIPKTSSRSITSPAGTADTMEVFARVSFPIKKMKSIVIRTNGCIVWGGSLNLAPADDKIISVEKALEIDAESQLLASIMAKKHSVSSTHILIDIPVGTDAKVKSRPKAKDMKRKFELIGKKLGKKIKVLMTDGRQPIGNGVGPALEARDVLWVLRQDSRRPMDLEKKSVMMAGKIFEMVGQKNGYKKAREILKSGKACKKFAEIIRAQEGKEMLPEEIKLGREYYHVLSPKKGTVKDIDNIKISRIARIAGAPVVKSAGIYLYKHIGDKIRKGEKLFTIYSESRQKMEYAKEAAKADKVYVIK